MPFDNKLVLLKLKGKDLVADLGMEEMGGVGHHRDARGGFVLADGRIVDPEGVYSVVTIDFLYLGGAHAPFAAQDPSATDTDVDWRAPVVAWTKPHHRRRLADRSRANRRAAASTTPELRPRDRRQGLPGGPGITGPPPRTLLTMLRPVWTRAPRSSIVPLPTLKATSTRALSPAGDGRRHEDGRRSPLCGRLPSVREISPENGIIPPRPRRGRPRSPSPS